MKNHILSNYDPANALKCDESIEIFLDDAFATGDASYIAKALGIIAKAKGMTIISKETGLSREQLYKSFSDKGNPTLKTILAVIKVLGLNLNIKAHYNH
jgi:probable addiction module antidote protein